MAEVRTGTHTAGWVGDPPRHIAIIMDGNGRWATKRGLPRTAGHKAGAETFRKIATYCKNIGVKYLTVYAFSFVYNINLCICICCIASFVCFIKLEFCICQSSLSLIF